MEQTITTTGTSSGCLICKYRMPCGYCELKKENCNWLQTISVPCDDNKWQINPIWKPNMNEVTCNAE